MSQTALAPASVPTPAEVTDGKRASKDAGVYVYSHALAWLLQLGAYALAARFYSKDGFSYLALVLLIYETAAALGSLGLPEAVFFFIGKDPRAAGVVVRQTSFLLLAVTVPVLLFVTGGVYTMSHGGIDLRPALPWLAVVLLVEMPTQPAVNQLIAAGKARLASALYVGFAALRAIAVLAPILSFGMLGPRSVPMVMAVTGLTRLVGHVAIMRRHFPAAAPWFDTAMFWRILAFAVPAGVAAIAGKLSQQIDKYVVGLVLGPTEVGEYSISSWEMPLITLVPYAVGAILQPRFVRLYAEGKKDELIGLWHTTVRKTALIVLPLTCLMLVIAPDLIMVLFGGRYMRAVLPFQLFTLVLLHRVASYGALLQALDDTVSLFVSSFLMLGVNAALSVPMTQWLGFPGAALATVVANVPAFAWTLRRIARRLGVPIRRVMPWRTYAEILGLSGGLAIALHFALAPLGLPAGVHLGVTTGLYLVAAIVVGRAVGLIHREDLSYLYEWLALKLLKK